MPATTALAHGGTQAGAAVDWASDVGRLDVRQLRRLLDVVAAGAALAKAMPGAFDASKSISDVLPVLVSTSGYTEFLDALVCAAASVAKRDHDTLYDLPLDEFIDAVRVIGVAVMERNAEYLAGPVSDAVDRVTRLLQEVSAEKSQGIAP